MLGLHILLADPDPEQSALLGSYLVNQGHNVKTCLRGAEIVPALQKAIKEQSPFELLILGRDLRGMNGLDVLEHIQALNRIPATIFIEPLEGLSAGTTSHIRSLGCRRHLPSPVDLGRLQRMLGELQGQGANDIPFFGTTKMVRKTETNRSYGSDQHPRPVTGSIQRPNTGAFERPGSEAMTRPVNDPFEEADAAADAEARRRSTADSNMRNISSAGYDRPRTGMYSTSYRRRRGTGTVRRSVTGRIERTDAVANSGTMQVKCAHCGEAFSVPRRDSEFNVMCIHCSKLNRIPAAIPPRPSDDDDAPAL